MEITSELLRDNVPSPSLRIKVRASYCARFMTIQAHEDCCGCRLREVSARCKIINKFYDILNLSLIHI